MLPSLLLCIAECCSCIAARIVALLWSQVHSYPGSVLLATSSTLSSPAPASVATCTPTPATALLLLLLVKLTKASLGTAAVVVVAAVAAVAGSHHSVSALRQIPWLKRALGAATTVPPSLAATSTGASRGGRTCSSQHTLVRRKWKAAS